MLAGPGRGRGGCGPQRGSGAATRSWHAALHPVAGAALHPGTGRGRCAGERRARPDRRGWAPRRRRQGRRGRRPRLRRHQHCIRSQRDRRRTAVFCAGSRTRDGRCRWEQFPGVRGYQRCQGNGGGTGCTGGPRFAPPTSRPTAAGCDPAGPLSQRLGLALAGPGEGPAEAIPRRRDRHPGRACRAVRYQLRPDRRYQDRSEQWISPLSRTPRGARLGTGAGPRCGPGRAG